MRYLVICLALLAASCSLSHAPGHVESETNMDPIDFPCILTQDKPCTSTSYGIDRVFPST